MGGSTLGDISQVVTVLNILANSYMASFYSEPKHAYGAYESYWSSAFVSYLDAYVAVPSYNILRVFKMRRTELYSITDKFLFCFVGVYFAAPVMFWI